MKLKPRVLLDIKTKADVYRSRPFRLNFRFTAARSARFTHALRFLLPLGIVVITSFVSTVAAPTAATSLSGTALVAYQTSQEERQTLESELQRLESQIAEYEQTIATYRKQGGTLKGEIDRLVAQVNKLQLQIRAVNLSLDKLDQEIASTSGKILKTEANIRANRDIIADTLFDIYRRENQTLLQILLENPQLSDFFDNLNSLTAIQGSLQVSLKTLVSLHEQYIDQKEQLGIERADAATLKVYRESQFASIANLKAEKDTLLKTTQGKEATYQTLLQKTKKTAAEIRSRIFELMGGGEMTFEDAYAFARYAESATGVRSALILAVLHRESALGKNVGQCSYTTAMHPTRDIPPFLKIVGELGLAQNLESGLLKVSCANADGAYGGAMGPAQFLPSTWVSYVERIAEITGNRPPSPWRNADAFVAAGLYLKDAGAAKSERTAAAKYYCGSRFNRYVCTNVYAQRVLEQAERFAADIKILNAN